MNTVLFLLCIAPAVLGPQIRIPGPIPVPTPCATSVKCYGGYPIVAALNTSQGFGGQIAVSTYQADTFPDGFVLEIIDLEDQCSAQLGYQTTIPYCEEPLVFQNASSVNHKWNWANLGSVFGLTIDNAGNIFTTAATCYDQTFFPNGGTGGEIYRIDAITGAISIFANSPLPNSGQGLGNIAYDGRSHQFFVSNMEDGLIYRIAGDGSWWGARYDHGIDGRVTAGMNPIGDSGTPGFTARGRRIWGLEVAIGLNYLGNFDDQHYRLFYAVWWENSTEADLNNEDNEIWSVGLDPATGAFMPSTARREIILPHLLADWSNPVADISFNPDGMLLLAERTMLNDTTPWAHASRLLAYRCDFILGWRWQNDGNGNDRYGAISSLGSPSCAGGVDWDFVDYALCDGRLWTTVDAIHYPFPYIYGLAGLEKSGSSVQDGTPILIDLDQDYALPDKRWLGDVELPCAIP